MQKTIKNAGLFSATALFAAGALWAAGQNSTKLARPAKTDKSVSCSACREKGEVLNPDSLGKDFADARPAYEVASKYPALLDKISCYCGCQESPNLHHKSLLSCFTSMHAAGCDICQGEAKMAGKLKAEGDTDDQIVQIVEDLYKRN